MKTKPYPQMTVKDFLTWLTLLLEQYPQEDHEYIISCLCNDENSTDDEILTNLVFNGSNPDYVKALISMREYFWDFSYTKEISL